MGRASSRGQGVVARAGRRLERRREGRALSRGQVVFARAGRRREQGQGRETGSYYSGVRRRREGRSGRRVLRAFPKAISGAKSALSRNRRGTVFQKLLKNEKVSTEVFFLNRYFTCLFP